MLEILREVQGGGKMTASEPLVKIERLKKHFSSRKQFLGGEPKTVKAVDDVSFEIARGETLGVVGESGCGKSTLGRAILRLHEPDSGKITYDGVDLLSLNHNEMRNYRQKMQIIFQDPYASLNPRMTVKELICASLDVFNIGSKNERIDMVLDIMEKVGLPLEYLNRYPHEFSGGQRQRIMIARALILNPDFVVGDEPVSALDVSVRAQVLNLMKDLQQELSLTYLFISHDLSVVRYLCDRILVMYLGKVMEIASKDELYSNAQHPYTQALLSSIPIPDVNANGRRIRLAGDVPSPFNPPSGCRFHTRCAYARPECSQCKPELKDLGSGHMVACHLCKN